MIDDVEQSVQDQRHKGCEDGLGDDDPGQKMCKCKPAAQQEKNNVYDEIAEYVRGSRKNERHLDIIVEIDLAESAGGIACQHIEQAIEAENVSVSEVYQKTADKAGENTLFLALHKSDRDGNDDHKIRGHRSNTLQREHSRLQNIACQNQNKYDCLSDQ